jgi:hypothetical protein
MKRIAVGVAFVVCLISVAWSQEKAKDIVKLKRVPRIVEVTFELQTTEPPNLVVTAVGQVPTGGWTEVQLLRRAYVQPPADGIWEYDLLAKPPEGLATQVISKVKATDVWEKVELDNLKGIRVYGLGEGIKTVKVGQ